MVAVDDITGELKGIIEYLNDHMVNDVSVLGLELGILRERSVKLLVPSTYGAEIEDRERGAQHKKRWTVDDLEQAIDSVNADSQRRTLTRLLDHAKSHGAVIKGGTGTAPSAGFYYDIAGKRRSVWSLYMRPGDPYMALNLGSVHNAEPEAGHAMLVELKSAPELAKRLSAVTSPAGRYPELGLDVASADGITEDAVFAAINTAIRDSAAAIGLRTGAVPAAT